MEKKKASLITMIMLIVFTVVSAIPFVYIEKYIKAADEGGYESYPSNTWSHNMYLWNIKFLSVVCVILAVIGIVCMFLQYNGKEHKLSKFSNYIPIATAVVYVIMSIYVLTVTYPDDEITEVYPKGFMGYWRFDGGFGFYLQLALLICCAVLCYSIITNNPTLLTSKSSTAENADNTEAAVSVAHSTSTKESFEELIKYKDLLDNGIITKEEFEEKKKQILGMAIPSTEELDVKEDGHVDVEGNNEETQAGENENDAVDEAENDEVVDNGQI